MEPRDEIMDASEARTELIEMARGKTGAVPADLLAEHVIAVTAGADWPVLREGMLAVLRRCASGKRDDLRVVERPAGRLPFGIYRTGRRRSSARPYRTFLSGVRPIVTSCDCADFLRSSLGVCKHALVVLNDLYKRPSLLNRAVSLQANGDPFRGPTVHWDPIRPLTGAGDWLERLTLHRPRDTGAPAKAVGRILERCFADGAGEVLRLRPLPAGDHAARRQRVEDLQKLVGDGSEPGPIATVPAVPALLAEERERFHHLTAHRIAAHEIERSVAKMRQKPYPYQLEGVQRFLSEGRLLLADDMGLGKTAQAITSCHILADLRRIRRGLLIVPAALKPQWMREWAAFTTTPITSVDGSPAERRATYQQVRNGFLLINYEQLLRDLEAVLEWNPELVVLDEAQRIKNWATKSAASVKSLQPYYRLVLTGTPMENRVDELASIYDWVDGFALEPKWRLAPWHVTPVDGVKEIGGARHLDTLRLRLAPTMLRRTRQEVLDQLPARTDSVVPVEMTPAQAEEHDSLRVPIASLMQRARRRPLTQAEFLKLMQLLTTQRIIANGMAQLRFVEIWPELQHARPDTARIEGLATPKLLELRELIQHVVIEQQRKVVVFSQWRRMLELAGWATRDVLARGARRAVFFTGQEKRARRTQNLVELHDDPATSVLFASDAGGVGLNLQKAASCCINLDLPWNPAVLEQRIGRIYRLGQKRPIDVYNLVSQDSIEARIAHLVADKKALFSSLFDGASDEVQFDSSGTFLSRLVQVVEPSATTESEDPDLQQEGTALVREVEQLVAAADESTDVRRSTRRKAPLPRRHGRSNTHRRAEFRTAPIACSRASGFARPTTAALPSRHPRSRPTRSPRSSKAWRRCYAHRVRIGREVSP